MSKTLSRLVFALWIAGAPLVMVGCSGEGEKPPAAPATTGTEGAASPSATPAEAAGAPATPAPEPAK